MGISSPSNRITSIGAAAAAAISATQDLDLDQDKTASPIVRNRHQSRHRIHGSRRGAIKVKPEHDMEVDEKRQGEGEDSANTDDEMEVDDKRQG